MIWILNSKENLTKPSMMKEKLIRLAEEVTSGANRHEPMPKQWKYKVLIWCALSAIIFQVGLYTSFHLGVMPEDRSPFMLLGGVVISMIIGMALLKVFMAIKQFIIK